MKNIWIFHSLDGEIYFSNPKKAYNYAKDFRNNLPFYSTYLKKLKQFGVCDVTKETSIIKRKVF